MAQSELHVFNLNNRFTNSKFIGINLQKKAGPTDNEQRRGTSQPPHV